MNRSCSGDCNQDRSCTCAPFTEYELTDRKIRFGAFVLLAVLLVLLSGCVRRDPEPYIEDQVQQLEKRVQRLEARAIECNGARP
jgi:hypothetical protein